MVRARLLYSLGWRFESSLPYQDPVRPIMSTTAAPVEFCCCSSRGRERVAGDALDQREDTDCEPQRRDGRMRSEDAIRKQHGENAARSRDGQPAPAEERLSVPVGHEPGPPPPLQQQPGKVPANLPMRTAGSTLSARRIPNGPVVSTSQITRSFVIGDMGHYRRVWRDAASGLSRHHPFLVIEEVGPGATVPTARRRFQGVDRLRQWLSACP